MIQKVAVILSGCGVFDGSEIYETTLTLLHLDKKEAVYTCLAPHVPQQHVVNHLDGKITSETRNVLVESARLARGEVQDIGGADPADFDAIIFPGGFGAAKNLSNFSFENNDKELKVEPKTEAFIKAGFAQRMPFGFICISPASVAAVALRGKGLTLTIGEDATIAQKIEALGHHHRAATARDVVIDVENKIVSTPAYMCGQGLAEVEEGIGKLVEEVLNMAKEGAK